MSAAPDVSVAGAGCQVPTRKGYAPSSYPYDTEALKGPEGPSACVNKQPSSLRPIKKPCILQSCPQELCNHLSRHIITDATPSPGGFAVHTNTVPKSAMTAASAAASVVHRGRCPAFPHTTKHPGVHVKAVLSESSPVTVCVVRPAVYVQARAAPDQVRPMRRDTSCSRGIPSAGPLLRVVLHPRVMGTGPAFGVHVGPWRKRFQAQPPQAEKGFIVLD